MRTINLGLMALVLSLSTTIAQANTRDMRIGYAGIAGYDELTSMGAVIRTPLEAITWNPGSPVYAIQALKVYSTPSQSYYGGYWFGLGFGVGTKVKLYVEQAYDVGSLIWNGFAGQPLSNTDNYTGYGIRFEGPKMGIAFYHRIYYFGNSFLSAKTGWTGENEFTGFTVYFRMH